MGGEGVTPPESGLGTADIEVKAASLQDLELQAWVEAGGSVIDVCQDSPPAVAKPQVRIPQRFPLQINLVTAAAVQVDGEPIAVSASFQPPLAAFSNIQLA